GTSIVSGLRIWDNVKNVNFAKANFLLDLDRVAGELYRSLDIPVIGFEGKSLELSFPVVSGDSLVKAAYLFDREKKVLVRRQTSFKELLSDTIDKAYTEKEVMAPDELAFSYYEFNKDKNTGEWTAEWPKTKGIFNAVKITGKFKNEEFTKTVFIPISPPR
ncbi:MAG: hypothetical protein NTW09_02590, partial [Candidatus Omnitrophica bacterium]|nr:hypothetical protein [Candidatus Omnitrophota bacterium]